MNEEKNLPAGLNNTGGGTTQYAVCYAIEGHVCDRKTANNGKGWCKDISFTLNTIDRHCVCYKVWKDEKR